MAATIRVALIEDGTLLDIQLGGGKGHILTMAMLGEVAEALESRRAERHLRAVVFRGEGSTFSFGASVEEHMRHVAPRMLAEFHRVIRAIARYPVPTVALVDGPCLGGAFEFALSCTAILLSARARLGCPEIKLGVMPPALIALGPLRLSGGLLDRLLVTGETLDADTAARLGIGINLGDSETLWKNFMVWFHENLRGLSGFSLRQLIRASRQSQAWDHALDVELDRVERQYVNELLASHDGNEGIEAFIARRAPVWEDA